MIRMLVVFSFLFIQLNASTAPIEKFDFYSTYPDSTALATTRPVPYSGGVLSIDSAGTYYLRAELPRGIARSSFLYLAPSPYGVTVELNGHEIYRWGTPDSTPCLANYSAEVISIDDTILTDSVNTVVVSFISDGARIEFPQMYIGDHDTLARKQFVVTFLNSVMIKVIVGIAIFAFLFMVMYFILTGCKDTNIIFLALFCLSLIAGYNMFVLNSYFFDQVVLFKVARVGGAMMSLTLFLFITSLTGLLTPFLYRLIVSAAFVPYIVLILNASSKFQINTVFNAATNTLIFPLFLVGLVLLLISLIKSKRVLVLVVFLPYLLLMAAVFSDMGYMIQFQQPSFWKIPYGYLAMIIGGIYAVLYNRAVRSNKLEKEVASLTTDVATIELEINEDARIHRLFLQQFSMITRHTEDSFKNLLKFEFGEDARANVLDIFAKFVLYSIHSNNLLYLDKIKSEELCLWYDGFSLSEMLDNKLKALQVLAEEQGVELHLSVHQPSFPVLVWGDQQAVFQIIANSILSAIETEQGTVLIQLRYISYEGLEIIIQGANAGFSSRMIELVQSAKWNGQNYPVAMVLRELLFRIDTRYEVIEAEVQYGAERIRTVLPLKLSDY